jgi:uncharacterized protein YukE
MDEMRRNMWVGIFVGCGLLALGALIVLFGQGPTWLSGGRYRLHVLFEHAGNIRVGNLVTVRGMRVGEVVDIDLVDPRRLDQGVNVTLSIRNRYRDSIREGAYAETGEVMFGQGRPPIEIYPGLADAPPLGDGAWLKGRIRPALDSVFRPDLVQSFQSMAQHISDAAEALTPVLQELEDVIQKRSPEQVDQGLAQGNISTAVARLDSALKHFNDVLGDPNVKSELRAAVSNVKDMTEKGQRVMGELEAAVQDVRQTIGDVRGFVGKADQKIENFDARVTEVSRAMVDTLDRMDRFLDSLNTVGQQMAAGEGNVGRLFMDDKLYESMLLTAQRLSLAVEEFRALVAEWRQGKIRVAF